MFRVVSKNTNLSPKHKGKGVQPTRRLWFSLELRIPPIPCLGIFNITGLKSHNLLIYNNLVNTIDFGGGGRRSTSDSFFVRIRFKRF